MLMFKDVPSGTTDGWNTPLKMEGSVRSKRSSIQK
jgi:hypothetical protein